MSVLALCQRAPRETNPGSSRTSPVIPISVFESRITSHRGYPRPLSGCVPFPTPHSPSFDGALRYETRSSRYPKKRLLNDSALPVPLPLPCRLRQKEKFGHRSSSKIHYGAAFPLHAFVRLAFYAVDFSATRPRATYSRFKWVTPPEAPRLRKVQRARA